LENEACEQHGPTPKRLNAYAISDLTFHNCDSVFVVNLDVPRGFGPDVSQSYHNRFFHLLVLFHAAMSAPLKRDCRSQTFATQITEQQP
jgi:hypothetical protein